MSGRIHRRLSRESHMGRIARIVVVSLSLVAFSYVGLGYVLGKTDDSKTYQSLTVYGEVMQRVQEDYVDEPDLGLVTAGSLHGLLESLDAYSGYFSPREYADYKDKEKRSAHGEIGATLAKRFGYVVIVSVLPDGAAAKAGLRDGDIIEAIGDFNTREMSISQANLLMEGAPGSAIKVAVVRRGRVEPQALEVQRAAPSASHVIATKVDDAVYLHMASIDAGTIAEMRDKLEQFDKQGVHKLVLDLRDCARGTDADGVTAAQMFLPSGTVTVLSGQTVSRQEFSAAPDKIVWRSPVEVLISDSTSGAAEIVASAIGDNKRGDLVGTRSFGSASEQKLIPMDDGSALILTVANYYTPKGKPILENGVPPTVEVLDTTADANPIGEDDANAPPPPIAPTPSLEDPVLRKALDLLNGDTRKAAWNIGARARQHFGPATNPA
jgi:carboxyl-terminal processing protease